jgi:hypothetical protein
MASSPWWCCVLPTTGDSRAEMESTMIMLGLESAPCNMRQRQAHQAMNCRQVNHPILRGWFDHAPGAAQHARALLSVPGAANMCAVEHLHISRE